jgi:hypothetical protein
MKRMWKASIPLAVAGVAIVAWLAPASSAAPVSVEVLDSGVPFNRIVDAGRPGFPTPGDEIIEVHDLLDPADETTVVGRALTHIEVLKPLQGGEDLLFAIDCTIQLADGSITFYGGDRLGLIAEGITLPVNGGTGAYAGASGTVTAVHRDVAGNDGALLTFDLDI